MYSVEKSETQKHIDNTR